MSQKQQKLFVLRRCGLFLLRENFVRRNGVKLSSMQAICSNGPSIFTVCTASSHDRLHQLQHSNSYIKISHELLNLQPTRRVPDTLNEDLHNPTSCRAVEGHGHRYNTYLTSSCLLQLASAMISSTAASSLAILQVL